MLEMLLSTKKRVLAGKDYPGFLAAVNEQKLAYKDPTGSRIDNVEGYYSSMPYAGQASTMWGTPYKDVVTTDSSVGSVVRHCFPNLVLHDYNANASMKVAYKVANIGTKNSFNSLARNSYTSLSYTSFTGCNIVDFIYYDNSLGKMMRYNPSLGDTPIAWDGKFL